MGQEGFFFQDALCRNLWGVLPKPVLTVAHAAMVEMGSVMAEVRFRSAADEVGLRSVSALSKRICAMTVLHAVLHRGITGRIDVTSIPLVIPRSV